MRESRSFDNKSLRLVYGKQENFPDIARDCVAFANVNGGHIHIGVEDGQELPPDGQIVPEGLDEKIARRIHELTTNVAVRPTIVKAKNDAEYIDLHILPSRTSVACTNRGEYLYRDEDQTKAVPPDELSRLFEDKPAFNWETKVVANVHWRNADSEKTVNLVDELRCSDRVSEFVKEKSTEELLEYYSLIDSRGYLTNLGVLWLGTQPQRARLVFSPIVQYIKYDETGKKVNKMVWDDYSRNPMELLEDIVKSIPDFKEFNEVSEGLWRKKIPAYPDRVVREILCNSLAHRPYTTRGDIFINVYPDHMIVVNPGRFPLGVSPENILQKSVKRNEHLVRLMNALHLMEAEGSGYDLMYEVLLSFGKSVPEPREGSDYVSVKVERKILNPEASRIYDYVAVNYPQLSQRALIAFGLILQMGRISAVDISRKLQLDGDERLRSYVEKLVETGVVFTHGSGKGTKYQINPKLFDAVQANVPTTLRTIEPYTLKTLIKEDLKYHPWSLLEEIYQRLVSVDRNELMNMLRLMAIDGELATKGGRKYRRYNLPDAAAD